MEIKRTLRERKFIKSFEEAGLTDMYLLEKLKEGLDFATDISVKSKYLKIFRKSKGSFPSELLNKVGLTHIYITGIEKKIEDDIKARELRRELGDHGLH